MPQTTRRTLNGHDHRVIVWDGPDGAPTVVLVHGYLDVAWSFERFAEALQERFACRIVAPDLRGHGESAWAAPGGYYHFADYVADLHDLLTSVGEPIHLLGHSMGANVSALLAGARPHFIRSLVLVEGLGPASHEPLSPTERMSEWLSGIRGIRSHPPRPLASLEDAAARLLRNTPRLPEVEAARLARHATRRTPEGIFWAFDPRLRTRSPLPYPVEQFRVFLKAITAPTLLVEGAESDFRTQVTDQRERDIAVLREISIEGAGHMVHHERPLNLADAVADFLRETSD
jgi:pimeloyl-ACP methyl ester carboxylesterase